MGEEQKLTQPLDVWVHTHGVTAAAWLLNKYRRELRRDGAVNFFIARGSVLPVWYQVAVKYLQVYAGAKWRVIATEAHDAFVWRIEWLGGDKPRGLSNG